MSKKCPTCRRVAKDWGICSDSFHVPPPPSPTQETPAELTEALDNLEERNLIFAMVSLGDMSRSITLADARKNADAARSALLSLYTRQREEIEWVQSINSALNESNERLLERLKADSLTFTEGDWWQVDQAVMDAELLPRPEVQIECLRQIAAKIRLSSDSGTEDTKNG